MRISKRSDATDRFYKAIIDYIESRGGKVVVIGGVEIQQWPNDGDLKFKIAVSCVGKKPPRSQKKDGAYY